MAIVLAFSGGLDTSFCVPYLRETYQVPVHTVTVDTGGVSETERASLAARSKELGAESHQTLDGKQALYDRLLGFLIKGNVLRGGVYPLCVGPELVIQAEMMVDAARALGATAVAHGSTGAGNDQVRFDTTLRLLARDLDVLTPIRSLGYSRQQSTDFLTARGFSVSASTTTYSINKGLWGTTIGGKETHDSNEALPEEAYVDTVGPDAWPASPEEITITYASGHPVALDGVEMDAVSLIDVLTRRAGAHGVGRGMHVGDTILGIKGRVGFEAPAATVLIAAHRELEKLVLTRWQQFQKSQLADFYGMLLHESQYFDPVMRDIEAFLDASQAVVTGTVRVRLHHGSAFVLGCKSPHSMIDTGVATYGETNALWSAQDAEGFSKILGMQSYLAHIARTQR